MIFIKNNPPDSFFCDEIRSGYFVSSFMKKVWAIEIDLLCELLNVCEKHNIKIATLGGTTLGAIRHQGFIPWDDDIDMQLDRDNYNKLCMVAPYEFKAPYFFQTEYTDAGSFRGHAQLRNSNTTAILQHEADRVNFNQGIFIDIFVLDKVISDEKKRDRQSKWMRIWRRAAYRMYINTDGYILQSKSLKRKLLHIPMQLLNKICSYDWLYKKFEQECARYNSYDCEMTGAISAFGLKNKRFIWKTEDLEEVIWKDFEYIKVPIPKCFDSILKITYGDYLKPVKVPSEHGKTIFDPEVSYKKYLKLNDFRNSTEDN